MSELLQLIVIVSAWCWGFYNAFQDGQVLGWFGNLWRENVPKRWLKPMIGCPVCMPSLWGSLLYFALISKPDLTHLLVVIVCASGLNFVIKEQLYGEND